MQLLMFSISRNLLYNLMSPFFRMCVRLLYPLGVVDYSYNLIPEKNIQKLVGLWMLSYGSPIYCKCGEIALMGRTSGV